VNGGAKAADFLGGALGGPPLLSSQPRLEVGAPTLVHRVRVFEEGQKIVVTGDEVGAEGAHDAVVLAL